MKPKQVKYFLSSFLVLQEYLLTLRQVEKTHKYVQVCALTVNNEVWNKIVHYFKGLKIS
jgi:hypothetical protein